MASKFYKNRGILTILISIIIVFIVLILNKFLWNVFYSMNDKYKKFTIETKNTILEEEAINNDIIIVAIDEETYSKLWFPFSRGEYARVIDNLLQAEVIWFDIMFANKNTASLEWDELFAQAIEKAWNVVLGSAIISKEFEDWDILTIIEPVLPMFLSWAVTFWYYQPNVDLETNTVTSFKPSAEIYNENKELKTYNHFAISILKTYFSKIYKEDYISYEEKDNDFYYLKPEYKIPYISSWNKNVLINFLSLPDSKENKMSKFPSISFLDVYENNINPDIFKGKIVIIWVTAKWLKDTFNTINWVEYWVYVIWNIINTILTKNYFIYFDKKLELCLIFLLILLSVYFNLSHSSYVIIFSNISISIIFLIIFPVLMLVFTSYLLNYLFQLFFAILLSLSISNIIKYLLENKDKIKLNRALSEYVSKAIADEIVSSSWTINLDWEIKRVTIYFSDIEWFTSISEKMKVEELVAFLREFLWEMSNLILDEKWFINKYEWDAIMALWWVFIPDEKSSYSAIIVALRQQLLLKELNKKWQKEWISEIKMRVGLHIWNVVVWNVGLEGRKMEFTALWDNVNLASRLEWVNKFYWTYLCVSEDIYKENKENFEFRYLDTIRVKWKANSVKIYELLALKWKLSKEQLEIITKFKTAVELYMKRDFSSAKKIFKELVDLGDNPSKTYLERCIKFTRKKPKEDWDMVWDFDEK